MIKTTAPENKENTSIQLSTREVFGSSPVKSIKTEEKVISQISFKNDFFTASPFRSPKVQFINKHHLSPVILIHHLESSHLSRFSHSKCQRYFKCSFPDGIYVVVVGSGEHHDTRPKSPPCMCSCSVTYISTATLRKEVCR